MNTNTNNDGEGDNDKIGIAYDKDIEQNSDE